MALAEAYRHGRGVPKDLTKAAHWFGRAAETGHPQAQGASPASFAKGRVQLLTLALPAIPLCSSPCDSLCAAPHSLAALRAMEKTKSPPADASGSASTSSFDMRRFSALRGLVASAESQVATTTG